jgi:hypothetical protein
VNIDTLSERKDGMLGRANSRLDMVTVASKAADATIANVKLNKNNTHPRQKSRENEELLRW